MTLTDFISVSKKRLDDMFNHYIVDASQPAAKLNEAIAYSVLNDGKRIRPLLVYLTGHAFHAPLENLDAAACAIELIHVYSLIHDDLPAMDNSDLRRGKPTCHKVFGDALAILAGDALQTLAFEIIATHPAELNANQRLKMVHILSQTSGIHGMAAGQTLDLLGVKTLDSLTKMYQLKTGALLNASVKLGIISANIESEQVFASLHRFTECIGLAFQIQDDLLDIEGSKETIGKPQGIDHANAKITYPSLIGIEQSRQKVQELFASALAALDFLGQDGQLLQDLTKHLQKRNK